MNSEQILLKKRDEKAIAHLEQYAPVWITDQKMIPRDEAVQFDVVLQHNLYGWVKRRYRYDGFNNVLYHKGQIPVSEAEVLEILDSEPYIAAPVAADIPNAYGG
jgi:hypothetical protein